MVYAVAGPYTVSSSGTFLGSAPTGTFTAPNGTFSFSLLVDSNPVPLSFDASSFLAAISSFQYRLNGTLVPAPSATAFQAYNAVALEHFDLSLDGSNVIYFAGPPLFGGLLSAPTILPGLYSIALSSGSVSNAIRFSWAQILVANAVPEPGTVGLGLGLVGMWAWRRRVR